MRASLEPPKRAEAVYGWGAGLRYVFPRWMLVTLLAGLLGTLGLRLHPAVGGGVATHCLDAWPWFSMWTRWDAGWYVNIATNGYSYRPGAQSAVAYFPLYPLLIRAGTSLGGNPFAWGIAVTWLCGLSAATCLLAWAKERSGLETARRALWVFLTWPYAFILFGAVYSDALFVALSLGSFLALERRRVWTATALGALAMACRVVGLAVALGLFVREMELRRAEGKPLSIRDAIPLLSGLGLAAYQSFLGYRFGDALAFLHAQTGWQQAPGFRTWLKLSYFKSFSQPVMAGWLSLHAALGILLLVLAVRGRRQLGWGYTTYVVCVLAIPLAGTKDFMSMGRYAIAAFPSFLLLEVGLQRHPKLRTAWRVVSTGLLIFATRQFAVGRYVA